MVSQDDYISNGMNRMLLDKEGFELEVQLDRIHNQLCKDLDSAIITAEGVTFIKSTLEVLYKNETKNN